MCARCVVLHPGASLTYHTDQKQTHKIQSQVKLTAHHKVQVQFSSLTPPPSTGNQSTAPVCDWEIEGRRKGPLCDSHKCRNIERGACGAAVARREWARVRRRVSRRDGSLTTHPVTVVSAPPPMRAWRRVSHCGRAGGGAGAGGAAANARSLHSWFGTKPNHTKPTNRTIVPRPSLPEPNNTPLSLGGRARGPDDDGSEDDNRAAGSSSHLLSFFTLPGA